MTYNTPSSAKKHRKSTEPKVARWPKCFLSSSSSDRLVQNCMTLSRWFSHKITAFYTEQCTSPSLFLNFQVSRGGSNRSLKNYGFISDNVFITPTAYSEVIFSLYSS